MPHNISKTKLKKFSFFSVCSKKYGYGHYNRIQNLITILKSKKKRLFHFSYGDKIKSKKYFLDRLKFEAGLKNNIILDITNDLFLDLKTIIKIKKILIENKKNNFFIIDSPTKKNLSTILNLSFTKTLIPFEVDSRIKKELSKINRLKTGFKYFIYSYQNIRNEKKIYDVVLSFGGSDNYKGTYYVLKLLDRLKEKKKILVIFGKYFKTEYKNKISNICKKNNYQINNFSKNICDTLNKSRLLITNSGLTKYEGIIHRLPVIVFSDSKESQKIDKVYIKKTKQFHFSYLKKERKDILKLKNILNNNLSIKLFDKNNNKSYMNNIRKFFLK